MQTLAVGNFISKVRLIFSHFSQSNLENFLDKYSFWVSSYKPAKIRKTKSLLVLDVNAGPALKPAEVSGFLSLFVVDFVPQLQPRLFTGKSSKKSMALQH